MKIKLKDFLNFIDFDEVLNLDEKKLNNFVIGLSYDTRKISKGELFLAIRGEDRHGAEFILDGINKGGIGVLIDKEGIEIFKRNFGNPFDFNFPIIIVEDIEKALLEILKSVRNLISVRIYAIAGSVGKTTTKEMLYFVFSKKYKVLKTQKSYNNFIGLPVSLYNYDGEDRVVVEVGTNHPGEIDKLASSLRADIGILTHIGIEHIEFFGSYEEIEKEELSLFKWVKKGILPYKYKDRVNLEKITFGERIGDIKLESFKLLDEGEEFFINGVRFFLPLMGKNFAFNALPVVGASLMEGFDIKEVADILKDFKGVEMRMEKKVLNDIVVIDDSYNSNPDSVKNLLDTFRDISDKFSRVILVLGDMLELGRFSEHWHRMVGKWVCDFKPDLFIGVGKFIKYAIEECRKNGFEGIYYFGSTEEAGHFLKKILRKGDLILLKASRKLKFEKILDTLGE